MYISGGAKKTFPTLTSHISNNRSTIAFKIGSIIVQYVLHEYAKLHYYLFRIAFFLSILVFHVKNCNIKTTVNRDHFDFRDAITFTIFFRKYNPRISFCGIISCVGMYGTPEKVIWFKNGARLWLAAVWNDVIQPNIVCFSKNRGSIYFDLECIRSYFVIM